MQNDWPLIEFNVHTQLTNKETRVDLDIMGTIDQIKFDKIIDEFCRAFFFLKSYLV